ncbi:MAG: hypothetical protein JSS02_18280 [Planctomycetes bacterium]|nr:hypothetical protein [Planctomycetota bacterium]
MVPLLEFPGVEYVRSWSLTLSHGVTPSVALVEIAPQFDMPAEVGTLTLTFGDVVLTFPGCALDRATVRRDRAGMIVSLAILDRRWAWRFGQITGRYNLRDERGQLLPETEKSPRELATMLCAALGETAADVSLLPDDARPTVAWVYANPAEELARLAAGLGCTVVLGLAGAVSLQPVGTGNPLPVTGTERTRNFGIDPPTRPDSLLVVCGPTRYETTFRLEAVGQEPTGEIVPLNELSYAPASGWENEAWLGFANIADPQARAKARQTVYRWYRLKCTAPANTPGEFHIAGYAGSVNDVWQLLPLAATRLLTCTDADGTPRAEPPELSGRFWDRSLDGQNIPSQRRYPGAFRIDRNRGLVQFAEPVLQVNPAAAAGFLPAELYLTIAHGVLEAATHVADCYTSERAFPGEPRGTGPAVLPRPDLARTVRTTYDTGNTPIGVVENTADLEAEVAAQLDAAQALYETRLTDFVEYAGLVPISPDGAITQVQWSATERGAVTRASRNSEFSLVAGMSRVSACTVEP